MGLRGILGASDKRKNVLPLAEMEHEFLGHPTHSRLLN